MFFFEPLPYMEAEIKRLSNEAGSGFEKEIQVYIKKLKENIKAKEKNMADTEKKLIGAMKQEEINPTKQ